MVDISTAFSTVKMPVEQLVLLRPPAILVRLGILKEDDSWIATALLEYVAEVLAKFEDQFMLKARNSAGEAETFGMVQQPTQQMHGLNLAAVAGSFNWVALRSRPAMSWAVSRAARLVSRDPSLAASDTLLSS
eukprot:14019-Amphidinium_carterae.2